MAFMRGYYLSLEQVIAMVYCENYCKEHNLTCILPEREKVFTEIETKQPYITVEFLGSNKKKVFTYKDLGKSVTCLYGVVNGSFSKISTPAESSDE